MYLWKSWAWRHENQSGCGHGRIRNSLIIKYQFCKSVETQPFFCYVSTPCFITPCKSISCKPAAWPRPATASGGGPRSGGGSHMSRKKHRERPCGGRSPGGGGASGGMVAHDLVNGCQAADWRDERSEPPEVSPPPGRVKANGLWCISFCLIMN